MRDFEWKILNEHGKELKFLEDRIEVLEIALKDLCCRLDSLELELEFFKERYLYLAIMMMRYEQKV